MEHQIMGAPKKHGMIKHRLYSIWTQMKWRCRTVKPNDPQYKYYRGKGITYTTRWEKFENFWEDMGPGYRKDLTLDRINSKGNYTKRNCRWATRTLQQLNKNKTKGVSSKYIGVSLDTTRTLWQAAMRIDGRTKYLGRFKTQLHAHRAYQKALKQQLKIELKRSKKESK